MGLIQGWREIKEIRNNNEFVFCTQTVKLGRLLAPVERLVHLGELIHSMEGVSQIHLCVMAIRTVLVAPMKRTVDPVRPSLTEVT